MRRQFLRDLGGDPPDNLGMKGPAKLPQYFRRRDNDELLEAIGVSMAIECFRQFQRKSLLGDVMPVGLLHRASGSPNACIGASRTIGALLARRRIVLFKNLFNDKHDAPRVASVPQKQSLSTVADEN